MKQAQLPFAPIQLLVSGRGIDLTVDTLLDSADSRAYYRAAQKGRLTIWAADRICIRLFGLHPCQVYGDLWWQVLAERVDADAAAQPVPAGPLNDHDSSLADACAGSPQRGNWQVSA